jgi:ribosomal-protein-alanine N-acetyltransferase
MNWAQSEFGISSFVASISPENEFSLRLVAKLGFIKVGEVMDDTDGMEYVFLHSMESLQ